VQPDDRGQHRGRQPGNQVQQLGQRDEDVEENLVDMRFLRDLDEGQQGQADVVENLADLAQVLGAETRRWSCRR
jgi:hypothetical protein